MQDLSSELIQIKALSQSILDLSPENSPTKVNNSLGKLESGLSPVPMHHNPYQNSYIEPMDQHDGPMEQMLDNLQINDVGNDDFEVYDTGTLTIQTTSSEAQTESVQRKTVITQTFKV